MKERRLKKWVVQLIIASFAVLVIVSIVQLFTVSNTYTTPVGNYTCKGGILQVCTGSKAVERYLGNE